MKKCLLSILLFIGLTTGFSVVAQAQVFNNEWINYSRTYYKFKVAATGLYRISQATLTSMGIGSTPAEHFQLWRNGRQVPLYTTVQTGQLGNTDYIEFWGEMNDGRPDSVLYINPSQNQLNSKWSLETDTAAFFLNVNPTGGNARFTPTAVNLPTAIPVEPYFMYTEGKYYKEKLNPGFARYGGENLHSSAYDVGEGWASADIYSPDPQATPPFAGTILTLNQTNLNPFTGTTAPAPKLKLTASGNTFNQRKFEIKVNGIKILDQTMDYFDHVKLDIPLMPAQVSSGAITVNIRNNSLMSSDRMSVHKIELVYPRQFNFGGS